jgi:Bacteriophage protein of unknown function (DUF646).
MANDGGLSSFQQRLRVVPKAARAAVGPSLVREAEKIAATATQLAPRKTGALAGSIAVTGPGQATPAYSQPGGELVVGSNQAAVTAGNTEVRYPHLVEYGHGNGVNGSVVPPHPFFWPAFRLNRKRALAAIKRAIGKAVRNAR